MQEFKDIDNKLWIKWYEMEVQTNISEKFPHLSGNGTISNLKSPSKLIAIHARLIVERHFWGREYRKETWAIRKILMANMKEERLEIAKICKTASSNLFETGSGIPLKGFGYFYSEEKL